MTLIKRAVYVFLFTLLGVMVSALVHAAIEAPLLMLITGDIDKWGDSFVWQNWEVLHRYVGGAIWVLGIVGGYLLGQRYWNIVYVKGLKNSVCNHS